jgi:hypothetical protein
LRARWREWGEMGRPRHGWRGRYGRKGEREERTVGRGMDSMHSWVWRRQRAARFQYSQPGQRVWMRIWRWRGAVWGGNRGCGGRPSRRRVP